MVNLSISEYSSQLHTQAQRSEWEQAFQNYFISPVLKVALSITVCLSVLIILCYISEYGKEYR